MESSSNYDYENQPLYYCQYCHDSFLSVAAKESDEELCKEATEVLAKYKRLESYYKAIDAASLLIFHLC